MAFRPAAAFLTAACALAAPTPAPAQDAPAPAITAPAAPAETWTGSATLPGGAQLAFSLNLTRGQAPAATIDIPTQGAVAVPLEVVSIEGDSVLLRIPAPANAEIAGTINDQGELAGMLKQAGLEFPFKLTRAEPSAGMARPQNPAPPFPYDAEPVEIEHSAAAVTLAGTLTIPRGDGPFPAAILISGSGPQDRDESLVGHKPFLVIADHLTRAGVAVLRYDDRGVAASTGDFASATTDDFAADALAVFNHLRNDPRIDPHRIGLIGHSEGGLAAPIAAANEPDIAYIVLLAGLGADGGIVLQTQQVALTAAMGAPAPVLEEIDRNMTGVVAGIRDNGNTETVAPALRAVLAAQSPGASDEQIDQALAQQIGFFCSGWMQRFVAIDPADSLARITQPALALFGSLDLQVLPSVNVEPMRAALQAAPTDDVTILTLPGLNHLFQTAKTGATSEYMTIEETFNPRALEIVSSWIVQRFGA